MTEQAVNNYENDQIGLLDILVTLAESWRLLVFGPLFAGLLAGVLSFLWPKTFESVAIVRLTEAELVLVNAAPVLDPIIVKFDLLSEFDGNQDDAREFLTKKISGKFDRKTGLSTITAKAATPERAQAMGASAIDALLLELLPKGKNKDQVEQTIRSNEGIIANNTDAVEQVKRQMGKSGLNDAGLDVVMKHYATLSAEVARKELENIELKKSLTVRGSEVFVQPPNLPQRKTSPKRGLVILIAMLFVGILLLLFVFIRKAMATLNSDAKAALKISTIKSVLGLKAS